MTAQARASDAQIDPGGVESAYAWRRLLISLLLATLGGVGLWSTIVALPAIQLEFGVGRASASLPYTATSIGFGLGALLMGRFADRAGIVVPIRCGALTLCFGYIAAAYTTSLWQFALMQGLLIGLLPSSPTYGPPLAHFSPLLSRTPP